jgi:hypothetical protein
MKVKQGDVVTFENGMVGAITEDRKVAMMDRKGHVTKTGHMPLFAEYNAKYCVVRIDSRNSDREDFTMLWRDEDFDFKRWCYKTAPVAAAA